MKSLLLAIPVLFLFGCGNPFVMKGGVPTRKEVAEEQKQTITEQKRIIDENYRLIQSQELQMQRNRQLLQGQPNQVLSQQQPPLLASNQGDSQRQNEEISQLKNQLQQVNDNQPLVWRCKFCNATEISGKRGDYIPTEPEVSYACSKSNNFRNTHLWTWRTND